MQIFYFSVMNFFITNKNEETEAIVKDFCANFYEEFPRSNQAYQPRSLAHYSRCEVRKCLSLSSTIPQGIKHLGLPTAIKNYVLLQNKEFEFHPRFNTLSNLWKFTIQKF